MKKFILFTLMIVGLTSMTQAQRIKKISGDAKELNGQSKLNVLFTYDNMRVGKYDQESEYISVKKAEYNKKEPSRGDTWESSWIGDRKGRFEPQFTELFEKQCSFGLGNNPEAKYTLHINTTRTEPGYNIYISRKNAEIDMEITIIETATKREVAKYTVKNAPGRTFGGYDYDSGTRIEESYATAGKHFGKTLKGDTK